MRSTRFLLALLFAAATLHAGETSLWQTDWNTAFKIAKEQRRLVFVDYFSMNCPPSRSMEETVLSKPDVQSRFNDFVLLRLDFNLNRPIPIAGYVLEISHPLHTMPTIPA